MARYAATRDGVVTYAELLGLGMSPSAIVRAAADGRLFRVHDGVFAVGRPDLTQRGRHRAALAAVGPGSALAGFSAAEHWGLLDGDGARVHVLSPRKARSRGTVTVHWSRDVPPGDTTSHNGLLVTSVPRTLLDLAGLVRRERLMSLCTAAAGQGRYDRLALLSVLRRGRRGSAALRRLLAEYEVGSGHTREELEHAFRRLLARHRIAPPTYNLALTLGAREVVPDAYWPPLRFAVELDSRRWHGHEPAFYADRDKDLLLAEAGIDCLRLTWRHVVGDEQRVAAALRRRVGTI